MISLLDLVAEDLGVAPKKVSDGINGPEYHSPCPWCGGKDRFIIQPERGDTGRYMCRPGNKCDGRRGDGILYYRDRRKASFHEACAVFGLNPRDVLSGNRHKARKRRAPSPLDDVRSLKAPDTLWQRRALSITSLAMMNLWRTRKGGDLSYLLGRGLTEKTIRKHRIGSINKTVYHPYTSWGMKAEADGHGQVRKLVIPAGISIPSYDLACNMVRLKIRTGGDPPYRIIKGSSTNPMVCRSVEGTVIVVESELDAILLHQEVGDIASVIALGSAQARVDEEVARFLKSAHQILVALDSDEAGAKAAWRKWTKVGAVTIWPIPRDYGKDPGEAYKAGMNLREWVKAGINFASQNTEGNQKGEKDGGGKALPKPKKRRASCRGRKSVGNNTSPRGWA